MRLALATAALLGSVIAANAQFSDNSTANPQSPGVNNPTSGADSDTHLHARKSDTKDKAKAKTSDANSAATPFGRFDDANKSSDPSVAHPIN